MIFFLLLDRFKLGGRGKAVVADVEGDGEGGGLEGSGGGVAEQRRDQEEGRRVRERRQLLEGRIQSNPTSQHYLQWKENTLRLARDKLVEAES
jgi:hypothetical protein